ncbi:CASP8 and FADD-like apoptosis regulator [Cottoperca gobio]|uniref:CASP8 and FADD-like apoptosis regulator n=1 Tax=Cottoperca gobio TaxID=56716 RepID=A0A6J2RTE5_COTGO|nr:CASP8 and FADD-like apoptosis regulator [Cottoperca gobio]XP_029314237.1 CASP8 and FADD-like apoptosis regulator [Cottoperca gobio]XP_029314238.1 CASP8 and FADD-like apoptosis regulator [Cottoperca gobio]
MALSDQRQLQAINQTVEALSSCERRRLFYLCEIPVTDNSATCMKEMLKSKVMCHERGYLFLAELMLQLRRFDILRKVYNTSREEVEMTLKHRQVLPRFRVLMANINEDMANEDLTSVKFLLDTTLSRENMEQAKSFLDVIIELEKLDKVSPERVDVVEELLRNIGRVDLAKKVSAYKMSVLTPERHSSQQQSHRAPCPFTSPNGSHSLQQTRQAESFHIATENTPVPIHREQHCQSQLDLYKFNTNPRGLCVIIDCVGNDGEMLEQTFKALHFKVALFKWLSVDDTLMALRGIFSQRENLVHDCFVCCIISRGTANHLLGTDSYGSGLLLDNVRRLFTGDACPMLAGKPKLFFFQRYSVPEFLPHARMEHRDEDLETDGFPRCDIIPTDADVFWSHCWTDECQLEQGHHRSIYLKALTDALQKGQIRKTHLVDVHTEVNRAIFEHNSRNPGASYHIDLKHTLRKDLYLK